MAKKKSLSNEELLQEIKKLIQPQIVYVQPPFHVCPPCYRNHYPQQTFPWQPVPYAPWYGIVSVGGTIGAGGGGFSSTSGSTSVPSK